MRERRIYRHSFTASLLLASTAALATGFDENYEVFEGDYNGDGYSDLYVRQKPQIVPVNVGDIFVPIVLSPPVEPFLLMQQPGSQTLEVSEVTTPISLADWQPTGIDVTIDDFNVDGAIDAVLTGVSAALTNVSDYMVYASLSDEEIPESARELDDDFQRFFRDAYGQAANPGYIDSTKVPTVAASFVYAVVLDTNLCWNTGTFFQACINVSDVLHASEATLVPDATVGSLPYLSDPSFLQESGNLLSGLIGQSFVSSPPPYNQSAPTWDGAIDGCYYYCEQEYGWYLGEFFNFSIYDVFIASTEVLPFFDRENYSLDALQFSIAVGEAFDDPEVALQADEGEAEQLLEGILDFSVGDTAAGFFVNTLVMPKEIPADFPTEELKKIRRWPFPLPDPANDPDWFPKKKWRILGRVIGKVGIVVCGLLICTEEAGENDDIFIWRDIGWENAIKQLAKEEYENNEQPQILIGEGEGGQTYFRIPDAASYFGALYYQPTSIFETADYSIETDKAAWHMNYGWLLAMMLRQAHIYDIGLYDNRNPRGIFYPCERDALASHGNYPRQEVWWSDTLGFSAGPCTLW